MIALFVLLSFLSLGSTLENTDCLLKDYGNDKKVCVCNSEHCDYFFTDITPGKINVITSTKKGARYSKSITEFNDNPSSKNIVVIDKSKKYQSIIGFGGALTDAAGINIKSLPSIAADHLMRSYFSGSGSMYNLCRVPMGGTDFSTRGYSYNDGPVDENLENFKLQPEDFELKIPLMKIAQNLSMNQSKLKFLTSTWTAPTWMKDNGKYYGGKLKTEYYQTWADYFLKFLKAYKEQGLDFWAITPGNEPLLARLPTVKINSIDWHADDASLWVREHLGPTLRNSEFAGINILAIDDQRSFFPGYVSNFMENETTRNYVDGFSVHWYLNAWYDAALLTETHNNFPNKFILSGEASNGFLPWDKHVDIGSWERGENYTKDIIESLNNWVTGWVDWNLVLDVNGGPTYINNIVDAAILVNATAGEFYKQPMYYAIGHFSKFVPEGSVRIGLSSNLGKISIVALQTPEPANNTVLVILNRAKTRKSISVQDGINYINLDLEEKSITTLIY